ncbi:hypothetical protein LTR37_009987 [Vermiconidia calcicola]|uniref:Uncharacterized protein n=1 Tax=Vermiconidia calcicola TaxID=1690605 RepID=A0ACC3N6A7_9PEZI|nr:hypothetical protein LTR37_009987 [Vermiconidia calcicola]
MPAGARKRSLQLVNPRTCPDEDLEFRGFQIPRGTTISQSNYLLQTDAAVFLDPYTFRPERYLGPGAAELQKKIVPFRRGARICVGMNLAWAELYLTIAVMISGVDMRLEGTTEWDATMESEYFAGTLLAASKGTRVRILGEAKA